MKNITNQKVKRKNRERLIIFQSIFCLILYFAVTSLDSLVLNDGLTLYFIFVILLALLVVFNIKKVKNNSFLILTYVTLALFIILGYTCYNIFVFSKKNKSKKYEIEVKDLSVLKKNNNIKIYYYFEGKLNSLVVNDLREYNVNYQNQQDYQGMFKVYLSVRKGLFDSYVLNQKINIIKK